MATLSHCVCLCVSVFHWFSLRSVSLLYRADDMSVSARFMSVDDRQNVLSWTFYWTLFICLANRNSNIQTNTQYFCLISDRSVWPHPKTNWKKTGQGNSLTEIKPRKMSKISGQGSLFPLKDLTAEWGRGFMVQKLNPPLGTLQPLLLPPLLPVKKNKMVYVI